MKSAILSSAFLACVRDEHTRTTQSQRSSVSNFHQTIRRDANSEHTSASRISWAVAFDGPSGRMDAPLFAATTAGTTADARLLVVDAATALVGGAAGAAVVATVGAVCSADIDGSGMMEDGRARSA